MKLFRDHCVGTLLFSPASNHKDDLDAAGDEHASHAISRLPFSSGRRLDPVVALKNE
jgi:hypothetical protein